MKKLCFILTLVFIMSIAGTALSAPANPFVDIPAKHWSYDAVAKLAKAGIVDGYGDGTFRGDRTMTRYEMAQVVAKAMARSDKADADNKALIDKLAVEFAAELNNLGVRVAKLEDKTKIGFNYESRIRYSGDSNKTSDKQGTSAFDWRQRIYAGGAVNDNVSFGMRLEAANTSFGSGAANNVGVNRMYFDVKNFIGAIDNLRVGRFGTLTITNGLLNGRTSNNDGIIVTKKMGDAKFTGVFADVNANSEYALYNLDFSMGDNIKANIGYSAGNFSFPANVKWPLVTNTSAYDLKTTSYDIGAQIKMGNLTLTGEYVSTKDKTNNRSPKAYAIQLTNGTTGYFYPVVNIVDATKAHTEAFAISYRSIEPNAVPYMSGFNGQSPICSSANGGLNNTLAQDDNVKGTFFTYQNVVSKNVVWSVEYQALKQKSAVASPAEDNVWQTSFQFYF